MKGHIYILFILTVLVTSCKKYGDGYISGTVYETGTTIPIQDALVIFELEQRSGDYSKTFDSLRTDSEGKFILYYKKRRGTTYFLTVTEKDHWIVGRNVSASDNNKKVNLTLYMDPVAYLKLRVIKNTSAETFISMKGPAYFGNNATINPYDTLLPNTFRIIANKDFINWQIYYPPNLNKDPINFSKEINVNKGATLFYTIQFD